MYTRYIAIALICIGSSAFAAPAPAPVKGLSGDGPIEINSDKLNVFQEENKAIFEGHVVAIQGNVRLKSDKMIVYYSQADKTAEKNAKPETASPMGNNSIKKIDVEGNVLFSSTEETASGTTGTYDVPEHTIYLNDNVVLTHGNNTLKGDKLTYNLQTGKSQLSGGSSSATQATGKGSQRVHALFVPESKDQKKNDQPKAKKP